MIHTKRSPISTVKLVKLKISMRMAKIGAHKNGKLIATIQVRPTDFNVKPRLPNQNKTGVIDAQEKNTSSDSVFTPVSSSLADANSPVN
ncbi:hypothetical protein [Ovoidimarina sediminis]|uniref:hypothetical protein n=1 Tax=Ovoidimarina sediminis TaxID=3079856 RepID=UPI00292E5057|nr:hypothetical protein [Rhodophyticola sp. MJ-SS7]